VKTSPPLEVFVQSVSVGTLCRTQKGSSFSYHPGTAPRNFVSATLPVRAEPYVAEGLANLHPFFAGLLPEGVMMQALIRRFRIAEGDLYSQLAQTGSDAIGDVTFAGSTPTVVPTIDDFDFGELREWTSSLAPHRIAGVQPKISLVSLMKRTKIQTPRAAYIAKGGPPEFPGLVSNEAFFMAAAKASGIRTAKVHVRDGVLIVDRFDRTFNARSGTLEQTHVEDALQLMDLYPSAKYSLEFRDILDAAWKLTRSHAVLLDLLQLYAFSYLIGNGDLHGKNVSLMLNRASGRWTRTPAYDLISTLPYSDRIDGADRMALALDDEQFGRFKAGDFVRVAQCYGLPENATLRMLDKLLSKVDRWIGGIDTLPFEDKVKKSMAKTIRERASALSDR
jgi:serine/threonine-protein kinase HipA